MLLRVTALPSKRIAAPSLFSKCRSDPHSPICRANAQMTAHKNVLGGQLGPCADGCGFNRDGFCRVTEGDFGVHAVAAVVTDDFLKFTKANGNDLSTPIPGRFPGLKAGDRWCLCASRWLEAEKNGKAPKVDLEATDEKALDVISLDVLKKYAV